MGDENEKKLTWREKTTIDILLFIAGILTPEYATEINKLSAHISVNG